MRLWRPTELSEGEVVGVRLGDCQSLSFSCKSPISQTCSVPSPFLPLPPTPFWLSKQASLHFYWQLLESYVTFSSKCGWYFNCTLLCMFLMICKLLTVSLIVLQIAPIWSCCFINIGVGVHILDFNCFPFHCSVFFSYWRLRDTRRMVWVDRFLIQRVALSVW